MFTRQQDWSDNTAASRSEEAQERIAYISFLVESYEPHCFWFEVVECVRRLALSSLLILM